MARQTKQEKLHARLRGDGEDEMRRRWRDAERRGVLDKDPNRVLFLHEVEKWATEARPARMKQIRERFGEREAEFRQGIADEAFAMLRGTLGQSYRLGEIGESEWFRKHRS